MSTPETTATRMVVTTEMEQVILEAPPEQLAELAGWLGRMTALVQLRIAGVGRAPANTPDRILEVEDVAKRFGQSKSWVYAHQDEFREFRLPTSGRLKFSERGLEKYVKGRGR